MGDAKKIVTQCRIKVGAVDAAALGPFKNRPTATDEKYKSSPYFGCDFCDWYNFAKIVKTVATRCRILKPKCTKLKYDFVWGSAPDAAGERTALL